MHAYEFVTTIVDKQHMVTEFGNNYSSRRPKPTSTQTSNSLKISSTCRPHSRYKCVRFFFYLWSNRNLKLLNGVLWTYLEWPTNLTKTVCSLFLLVSMSIRSQMYVAAIYYLSFFNTWHLPVLSFVILLLPPSLLLLSIFQIISFFWNELFRRYFQNVFCLKVLYIGVCTITPFNFSIKCG